MCLRELRQLMRSCPQTKTQNVLEHGFSVARYFRDLQNHIQNGTELKYQWRLPEWIHDELLWSNLFDLKIILRYQIYHDCGKPVCRVADEQGHHFPNHAEVSSELWLEYAPQYEQEARLMAMDMDLHLMKPGQEKEFAQRKEAATLLITSLCELHSNASMFGGIQSTSFKIKWKKLNKFGKRILNEMRVTK